MAATVPPVLAAVRANASRLRADVAAARRGGLSVSPSLILQLAELQVHLNGYPFASFPAFLRAMRLRSGMIHEITPAEAVAEVQHLADQVQEQFQCSLDEVIDATRFDAMLQRILLVGLGVIVAGAAAGGAIAGPYGALVGAIIGAVIATVLAIIPFEKMQFLDRWGHLVATLTPVERYGLLHGWRELTDHACDKAGTASLGPWLYQDPTGYYTPWSGPNWLTKRCWEILLDADCFPATVGGGPTLPIPAKTARGPKGEYVPPAPGKLDFVTWLSHWDPEVLYALCCAFADVGTVPARGDIFNAGHVNVLRETWFYNELLGGKGPQWLRAWFEPIAGNCYAQDAYDAAAIQGMHDFGDLPWTEPLAALAQQRAQAMRDAAAAAAANASHSNRPEQRGAASQ